MKTNSCRFFILATICPWAWTQSPQQSDSFSSVQSLSRVRLFATPWTTACQTSLSITNSRSSLKLTSIESVMPSSHLILCRPPSPHAFNLFQYQGLFKLVSSSHQVAKYYSFSFNISPSNEHSGLISFRMDWLDLLQSNGLSRVFSNTTVQKHQFFGAHLSLWSNSDIPIWPLEKP